MPFTINHQPNPFVSADAARAIGMAQFLERERQLAVEQERQAAQLAQRDEQMAMAREQLDRGGGQPQGHQRRFYPQPQQSAGKNRILAYLAGQQAFGEQSDMLAQRFGQQRELQQNEFEQEQARQDALLQRELMGQQSQLQRERQAQIARRMDAEWQAALEHRNELTPEEWADVERQFTERAQTLGMEPPVSFPGSNEQTDGQARLEEFKQRYPKLPWRMGKDGEPELPRGFNLEMDEEYRQQQMQHEIEKVERTEAVKIRVQEQAAAIKEAAETTKRESSNMAAYTLNVGKARSESRKLFVKESAIGEKSVDEERAAEYVRQQEAIFAAGYQIPAEKRVPLDGSEPEAASAEPTSKLPSNNMLNLMAAEAAVVVIRTVEARNALPSGARYMDPTGTIRIKP